MQRVSFSSHLEEYFPVPGRDKFAADLSQKKDIQREASVPSRRKARGT